MPRPNRSTVSGQAAVELVALLPLVVMAVALVAQLGLAAHAAWAAEQAAQSAARAIAVGLDARSAARSALPPHLEMGLRLRRTGEGAAELRLRVPGLLPVLGPWTIEATARFEPQT